MLQADRFTGTQCIANCGWQSLRRPVEPGRVFYRSCPNSEAARSLARESNRQAFVIYCSQQGCQNVRHLQHQSSKHLEFVPVTELQSGRIIEEMEFDRSEFPLGRYVDSAFRSLYRVDVGNVPEVSEIHATSILDVTFSYMFLSSRLTGRRLKNVNAQLPCSLRPWRRRRNVPPKCRLTFNGLHDVISWSGILLLVLASTVHLCSGLWKHSEPFKTAGDDSDWLLNCCWPSPAHWFLVPNPAGSLQYINSSYLTGSTLSGHYKAQPVNAVYCENHTEHTDTLCGQNI
jgi:hypothetical protein